MIHRNSILIFLIFAALSIRCINITLPWIGDGDSAGALIGNCARNAIRYGSINTTFGACINSGPVMNGNYSYYINHPLSLFVFLTSMSYRIFGIHEWSTRLVPIIFSIGVLIIFYAIIERLWDRKIGIIATMLFSFNPLTAFFDRMVWYDPLVLFFILTMIYFYINWINKGKTIYFIMMIVFQALGLLSGWPAYYIAPLLLIHRFFYEREKAGRMILPNIVNILFFTLHLLHIQWLRPGLAWTDLWNVFLLRTGSQAFTISWLEYLNQVMHWGVKYFTLPLCLFSGVWLVSFFRNLKKTGLRHNILIITLLLWGCIHIALFSEGVYAHKGSYWFYYFTPFFALSGALGLTTLEESVLAKIIHKSFGKQFFWSLIVIATLGGIFLAFQQSSQPDIGRYSWFFFKIYMVCICLAMGLAVFTWRTSQTPVQKILHQAHPVILLLLFVFLIQSLSVVYSLHREKGYKLDYALAKAINENSQFEDAIITSLNPLYYYIPYYADRYVVQNIRSKDDYLEALNKEKRAFKYYITTDRALMRKEYLKNGEISESVNKWLDSFGIKENPCELDDYMSKNFEKKIVDNWIVFGLSKSKNPF